MKIAVVGGAGLTGQCAVRDLLRNDKVERIIVADNDQPALERLKARIEDERVKITKVDVTNHSETSSVLRGCDVVINAVQYYYNLDVMKCALEAGTDYLDFGGLYHTTMKQIETFNESFAQRGVLGVIGMGAQPGVSNLMVKHALNHFSKADSVEILDGWRDLTKSESPMYFTWSPMTFFDESEQDAIVFENGRYVVRPPFSEPESVSFPKPIGKVNVYLALHSELATLPKYFARYGIKKLVWKEGGADFWKIKFLSDLGLTSKSEIRIDGASIPARKFFLKLLESKGMLKMPEDVIPNDYEITRVIVMGKSGSKKRKVVIDAFFPPYKSWKVSCSQYNVGIPGSIAAQLIAKKKESLPKGVHPPEALFDPLEFFAKLETKGIKVRTRTVAS